MSNDLSAPSWTIQVFNQDDTVRLDLRLEEDLMSRNKTQPRYADRNQKNCVYKIESIACLSKDAEDKRVTIYDVVASADIICIALSTMVYVLNVAGKENTILIALEHTPQCIALSHDSKFLAIVDIMCNVTIYHVQTQKIVVGPYTVVDKNDSCQCKAVQFTNATSNSEREDLVIVWSDMKMSVLSNLDTSRMQEKNWYNNEPDMINIGLRDHGLYGDLLVSDVTLWNNKNSQNMTIATQDKDGKSSAISVWHCKSFTSSPSVNLTDAVAGMFECISITKVCLTHDNRVLVTLDSRGSIHMWDMRSLILLDYYPNVNIFDFILMSSPAKTSDAIYILALSNIDESTTSRSIQVIKLPGFVIINSVKVSIDCWLVRPENKHRRRLFYRTMADWDVDTISLVAQAVSETIPLKRFEQLISKRKYADAIRFAEQFDLDVEVVLKAKFSNMLTNTSEDLFEVYYDTTCDLAESLIKDLSQIKDDAFRINFCLQAILPTQSSTYKLLCYARSLIQSSPSSNCIHTTVVHQAIQRLGTWQMLNEYRGSLSGENACFNGKEWQKFRVCDLGLEMRRLIGMGNIKLASVVWRRHCIDEDLMSVIEDILNEMPENISIRELVPWLRDDLLPRIQNSEKRVKVISWVEHRARMIELREQDPHNALEIMRLIDDGGTDENCENTSRTFASTTPACYVDSIVNLPQFAPQRGGIESANAKLRQQLEDLVYLWDTHNFRLSLKEFCHETPNSIAIALLDCVAASELLQDAVARHFIPYVEKCGLPYDDLLVDYCLDYMDGVAGSGTATLSNALWESRILILVDCIRNVDSRVDVLIEFMRRTAVPWSDGLEALIKKCSTEQNLRRKEEFQEQYRLLQMRKMLLRYGIKNFNISDSTMAKGLLSHVLEHTDVDSVLEDSLMIVDTYPHLSKLEVYVLRMQTLCMTGSVDKVKDLLEKLTEIESAERTDELPNVIYCVCQQVLAWLIEIINDVATATDEELCVNYSWAINTAIEITHYVLSNTENEKSCTQLYLATPELLKELSGLKTLYQKFDIIISLDEYRDETVKRDTVRRFIEDREEAKMDENSMNIDSESKFRNFSNTLRLHATVYALTDVLGMDRIEPKGLMAEEAALRGDFQTAFTLCKELCEKYPGPCTAHVLIKIALLISKYISQQPEEVYRVDNDNKRLTTRILQLCQNAVLMCEDADISEYLDVFKTCELQDALFAQSELGDYRSALNKGEPFGMTIMNSAGSSTSTQELTIFDKEDAIDDIDAYATSLFEDHYHEVGLVLRSQECMELATSFTVESYNRKQTKCIDKNNRPSKMASKQSAHDGNLLTSTARRLMEYLRQNSSLQIALYLFQLFKEQILHASLDNWQDTEAEEFEHWELLEACVQKVLTSRHIDHWLGLGYMISLPMDKAYNTFRDGLVTVGSDYNRLIKLAGVGMGCATLWRQRTLFNDCKQLGANGRWWHQLRLLEIPFDDGQFRLSKDGDYQRKLIPALLKKTNFDIITVLEFTREYNIEADDYALFHCVKMLLFSEVDNYQSRIAGIIDDIVGKDKLSTMLMDHCLTRISPYDYERIHFLLKQVTMLQLNNENAIKSFEIIETLMNYSRNRPPSLEELAEAKKVIKGVEVPIGVEEVDVVRQKFPGCLHRLPFHLLRSDPWTVLKPELTEESISKLWPLTTLLGIRADKFLGAAIENLIARLTADKQSQSGDFKTTIKFNDFKGLVQKMQDNEVALTYLKYIADTFPCGPDRIQALQTGVYRGEYWYQSLAAKSVSFNYISGWAKKRFEAETWIAQEQDLEPGIKEITLPSMRMQANHGVYAKEETSIQKKLLYLLSCDDIETNVNKLLKYAYQQRASPKVTTLSRIRALSVLFQIACADEISRVHDYQDAKQHMQMLLYLIDFEELRISQTPKEFINSNKEALARSLWVKYSNEPKVVQLICNICLDYKVYDLTLWENSLKQLAKWGKHEYLMGILERTSTIPELALRFDSAQLDPPSIAVDEPLLKNGKIW
ncbi:10906_t:CDS:10 [Paraglomus occultum]|uniref:10906_t:CDS:1 n=1 Tax=Paraglomus occultum TaxID=144539 RepID=A0A9N9AT75_9GLOM|nr:10906_t:CDS:10 [Paraglomus occultum]